MNQNKNSFKNDIAECERCVLVFSILGIASAIVIIVYSLLGI